MREQMLCCYFYSVTSHPRQPTRSRSSQGSYPTRGAAPELDTHPVIVLQASYLPLLLREITASNEAPIYMEVRAMRM